MRTIVYVDGFNLYYGLLNGTRYKWLDLMALFQAVLKPHHEICGIKYFTARVKGEASNRQDTYLAALKAYLPSVQIHYGHFSNREVKKRLVSTGEKVTVWDPKEKRSDVNLAAHLLNDAWRDDYDCGIVVSNDSDLAEAMRLASEWPPNKRIGLLPPTRERVSGYLKANAHFVRKIRESALENSQLPSPIPGTTIWKPDAWA